jgi:formylglycine-generating enzyme required for sulfatase activity
MKHTNRTKVRKLWFIAIIALLGFVVIALSLTGCDPDGNNNTTAEDNAAITTAKGLVEGATYTDTQANITDAALARAKVEAVIGDLTLGGVTAEVVNGAFTAATAGDSDNPNGTNGSFTFTVKLNKGMGAEQTTTTLTLTITATFYSHGHNYTDGICTVSGCFMIHMIPISAGNFVRDGHTITLNAFKMSGFQVTQELYEAVIGNNPSYFHGGSGREPGTTNGVQEIQGKRPVETVTWFDAVYFSNRLSEREGLTPVYTITNITRNGNDITSATVEATWSNNGYRLPTEAQWEYACRAGSTTLWHFGNTESELVNYAWYNANSNSRTRQVGLKPPNQWGLYDMHGNVWEWVWDRWGTFPNPSDLDNPTGAVSGTSGVRRGGSWGSTASNTESETRGFPNPGSGGADLGFRLALP